MSTYQTIAAAYPWGDLLPLPAGVKTPPPAGFTGSTGRAVTEADKTLWAQHQGNYALRLPDGVVGLDVDQYDGKHGLETVRALEAQLGPLPATWTSTGRPFGTGSGIRFYRYPGGKLAGSAGPSVEVIQHEHRYAAVWPSVAGERVYRWHTPAGEPAERVPALAELAELPEAWVTYLREGASASLAAAGADESRARSVELLTDTNAPCGPMSTAVTEGVERLRAAAQSGASRHDVAASAVLRVAMLGSEGHSGAGSGLDLLRAEFDTATATDPARAGEFDRLVTGAAAKAAMAHPYRPSSDPCEWFGLKPNLAPTPAAAEAVAVEAADPAAAVRERYPALALSELLNPHRPQREFVVGGFLPAGASVAMVAPAGVGKSLLSLGLALAVAGGEAQFAGLPIPRGRRVLYVDMENTEDDLAERFDAFGVDPTNPPARLAYLSFPPLPALDTSAGGAELVAAAEAYGLERGDLVVLDSFQRVVDGAENDADTARAFYRHTALHLKRLGLTVLRLDNTGKDKARGARGTSSKRDDVDLQWELETEPPHADRFKLHPGQVTAGRHAPDHLDPHRGRRRPPPVHQRR